MTDGECVHEFVHDGIVCLKCDYCAECGDKIRALEAELANEQLRRKQNLESAEAWKLRAEKAEAYLRRLLDGEELDSEEVRRSLAKLREARP